MPISRPEGSDARHRSKVLVTGGSGFIGSHVVDRLLDAGHEARIFDVLESPYKPGARCETVIGDLLDPASILAAAEGCDAIMHLAAAADVGLVAKDPAGSEALNSRGTLNVLEAARETGARVIYASTIWVYSDVVGLAEVDEDTPLALPSHLYTATKLAGEMYCRSYEKLYDVQTTILRFGIPYGPRARPAAVLPIFVNKALAGDPLTIAGDGRQTRRFVYVEDLADGVVRALAPAAAGRIYNLVGEEDTTISAIAEAVRDAIGEVQITYTEGRPGDFAGAQPCCKRAARELGWSAQTPYAEGVKRYVAWHRDNAERVAAGGSSSPPATPPAMPAAAVPVTLAPAAGPPRRRSPHHALARATSIVSGLLALVLYIVVLHRAGLQADSWHTVLVVAALGLTASVSTRSTAARVAVWLTALAGAAILIPAGTSEALAFAPLNVTLLMLGIAGAGIGLLGVAGGRRTVLEPSFADRGRPLTSPVAAAFDRFAIGFDERDRGRLHELWDTVIDSQRWSEGPLTARFEAAWEAHNALPAVALASWTGGALAALEWAQVRGRKVVVPSNTFMATPLAVLAAGATPVFGDCRRDDLCLSLAEAERLIDEHDPAAVFLVHIGGHIAFDSEAIATLCRERGVILLEDCAHAHGAVWNERRPGSFGDAGIYSLYATKTISTGEGGVLVSRHPELIEFTRAFRNYAKPGYAQPGLNFRMNEFTAALGVVQTERLPEIVAWKNEIARTQLHPAHPSRLELPEGMVSGLYKYIVFDWLERSTGRVYDEPCHRIMGTGDDLPNSDWVARSHSCVPLYYRPAS